MHGIKAYRGDEVYFLSLLTSELSGHLHAPVGARYTLHRRLGELESRSRHFTEEIRS